MIKINSYLPTVLFILLFPAISFGALFTSQADGDWHLPATWGQLTAIPGPGDDVMINGDSIVIRSGNVEINNLTITNTNALGSHSILEIKGNYTIDINGNVNLTAENYARDIKMSIYESAIVNVTGDMTFERTSDNVQSNELGLIMYGSAMLFVDGSFDYYYRSSDGEASFDIQLWQTATLTVGGASTFQQEGGNTLSLLTSGQAVVEFQDSLDINLYGGTSTLITLGGTTTDFIVGKTLTLNNTGGTNELKFSVILGSDLVVGESVNLIAGPTRTTKLNVANNNSTIDIEKDLTLDTQEKDAAIVNIYSDGTLNLGGNLKRPHEFGVLTMANSAKLYFDGADTQIIPKSKYDGVADSLEYTQVYFDNSNGFILDGNVTIKTDLTLTDGIIYTQPDSILILDDGVNISGGSSSNYIDGPMVKRGTHSGTSFIFPTGDNGIFAPIGIETITDASLEYTANAIGCPPPIGIVNGLIENINNEVYWELERNDGAAVGNISLHWENADQIGISDTTSLVVTYFDPMTGWHSLGRSNATGSIGAAQGSIQNNIGCPPPIEVQTFAFGSTDLKENALPVELNSFKAFKSADKSKVFLEWRTASEENTDVFVIEKSLDGRTFREIDRVTAAQNSTTTRYYSSIDPNPEKGNNYYRIQEVSMDQLMSFSNMVNVFFNGQEEVPIIYPNPVQNQLRVFSKDLKNKTLNIKVLDITGQCLYTGNKNAQDGQLNISTSSLNIKNPGIYFISYEIGGEVQSLKFMKVGE